MKISEYFSHLLLATGAEGEKVGRQKNFIYTMERFMGRRSYEYAVCI